MSIGFRFEHAIANGVPIGTAAMVVNGSEKTNQTVFGLIGNLNLNLVPYIPTVIGNPSP